MKKRLLLALLAAAAIGWHIAAQPAPAVQNQNALFDSIGRILQTLEEITGLKALKPIQHEMIGREQVKKFLEDRIREEIKPEELRAEELTLKKFGFVPQDFDLKKTTVELLTEQAAAFYDYRKKKLYILESEDTALQQMALVHELAHALADQHFNLDKYIRRGRESDDGAMARLAVMEGQAMWIMAESMARQMNLSLRNSPALATYMGREMSASAGQFPVFDKAPLYIQETLLFPYTKGILFQQALIEKFGQEGFAMVFQKPPLSTQQILHPEKYFAGDKPTAPVLPALRTAREYRTLAEGSLGQLDLAILLRQYAGEAEAESVAPKWRGGAYRLLEHKKDGRLVLVFVVDWDSDGTAQQFLNLYRKVLAGKSKILEFSPGPEDRLSGKAGDGHFLVRRAGTQVWSIEGLRAESEVRLPAR